MAEGARRGIRTARCDGGGKDAERGRRSGGDGESGGGARGRRRGAGPQEMARVEQAVGGVEHPDGDGMARMEVSGRRIRTEAGDEPGPKGGDGGRVERKEVPEGEQAHSMAALCCPLCGGEDGHTQFDALGVDGGGGCLPQVESADEGCCISSHVHPSQRAGRGAHRFRMASVVRIRRPFRS